MMGKNAEPRDENHVALLLLMKPGVWYCTSEYAGCTAMPGQGDRVSAKIVAALAAKGFIESVPVFHGFMTKKHRITPSGVAWLAEA